MSSFIFCPSCQGRGRTNRQECFACHGEGLYRWFGGYLLYWKKDYLYSSALKNTLLLVQSAILNIILVLFGIVGLIFGLSAILNFFGFSFHFPWPRERLLLLFLFSLITDLYLFYSYCFFREKQKKISPASFTKRKTLPMNWDEIRSLGKRNKINVCSALSKQSETVINRSWKLAIKLKHLEITPLHLMDALLEDKEVLLAVSRLGLSKKGLKTSLDKAMSCLKQKEGLKKNISYSVLFKKIMLESYAIAGGKKHLSVEPLDIFEAIFYFPNRVGDIFYDLEIGKPEIINVCLWIDVYKSLEIQQKRFFQLARYKPKKGMDRAYTAIATPLINTYCQDLTEIGRQGYLNFCLDRKEEISSIFRAFESGQNGVILVGNPGVGKMTIINGIARRMVTEDVPSFLQDKRLVSLSLSQLVGGATRIGELEERLNLILREAIRSGNIIFFVRDIHNMIGVKGLKGELDISEILADAVKNRLIFLLSTSIPREYHRLIERSALGEALTEIPVLEPDDNTTIQILEVNIRFVEAREKVYFAYSALSKAVELSKRYLHERFLPEKAINLLNETAVFVANERGRGSVVQGSDVAYLVSKKLNIPLTKITIKESEKLLNLEQEIHKRIIDQDEAVKAVAAALRRARTELRDIKRPIVNLLFLGPTGVGKTELAKTVSSIYFGSEGEMVRLDMSEYQTKESIDRLIGSPDGKMSGHLTEAIRRNPYTLLLLDEIEKSHPDILNIFLQVMDDGRLTDASGRTIDFTNVILIGTSNAGTAFIQDEIKKGTPLSEINQVLVREKLRSYFRPEFLNRFDDIIVFKPLGRKEIREIAKLMLKKLAIRLEKKGIKFQASEEAIDELASLGFDPTFGARPLRRVIQERVNNALANYFLKGKLSRRDIAILEKGGKIKVVKPESRN